MPQGVLGVLDALVPLVLVRPLARAHRGARGPRPAGAVGRGDLELDALEHAKKWAALSPPSKESRQANHMETLAFSNQMQRLAFAKGLIGYDPERSRKWISEERLLRRQLTEVAAREAKERAANAAMIKNITDRAEEIHGMMTPSESVSIGEATAQPSG